MKNLFIILFIGVLAIGCGEEATSESQEQRRIVEKRAQILMNESDSLLSYKIKVDSLSGTFYQRKYSNPAFGFEMMVPESWIRVSEVEYQNRNQKLRDEVRNKIPDLNNNLELYQKMFCIEKDATVDSIYCSITFIYEDVSKHKKSPHEYLLYVEKWANTGDTTSFPKFEFGQIKIENTIGGKEFLIQPCFIYHSSNDKEANIVYVQQFKDKLLIIKIGNLYQKEATRQAKELLKTVKWIKN